MDQIAQQAERHQGADVQDIHYLPPNLSQPAAKAQVKPKNAASAPMYIASMSSLLNFVF